MEKYSIKHFSGFTLIELLVVVLIIGILAAVAVPQYQVAVMKSRFSFLKNMTESIARAEEIFYLANGGYTADWEKLDISLPVPNSQGNIGTGYSNYLYTRSRCALSQANAYVECVLRKDNQDQISYQVNLEHNTWASYKRQCTAHTTDESAVVSKVCKNETKKKPQEFSGKLIYYYK